MVVYLNTGPQYRLQNIIILIMETHKTVAQILGKAPVLPAKSQPFVRKILCKPYCMNFSRDPYERASC